MRIVRLWCLTACTYVYACFSACALQPHRALRGHGHFVSDVIISSDGQFALSGSWDGTLRLWEIKTGKTTRRFVGHSKDVLSVAFSVDNRQIVSGSRDKTVKLWNTLVSQQGAHSAATSPDMPPLLDLGRELHARSSVWPIHVPWPVCVSRVVRVSASIRSWMTATRSGCRASASRPPPRRLSSSLADGTSA